MCRMKKDLHPEYHEEAKVSFCQLLCSPSACPCSQGSCRGRCSRPTQAGGAWRDGVTAGAAASSSFGCNLQQHGAEPTGARPALALRRPPQRYLGNGRLAAMPISAGCAEPSPPAAAAPRACHSACVQVYCNGEEVLTTSGTQAKYTVDIWSGNHPFFQGSSSTVVVDEGRVNRFKRRYAGLDGLSDMSTMKQGAPFSGSAVVASFPCRHPAAARSGRIQLFPPRCRTGSSLDTLAVFLLSEHASLSFVCSCIAKLPTPTSRRERQRPPSRLSQVVTALVPLA